MAQIVTVHSYRGGTGKSTMAANAALLAASRGLRVAIVDTDIQTPGMHLFFGLDDLSSCNSLADYLVGRCEITDAVDSCTQGENYGKLYLVPARSRLNEVNEILGRGYDIGLLREGFDHLIDALDLDLVFLDTHSGMGNETITAVAMSSSLLIITRADHLVTEARENMLLASRLGQPNTSVIVNMVPDGMAAETVRQQAEQLYESPVIAMLPYCPEVAILGSGGLFARHYPDHVIVSAYHDVTSLIVNCDRGLSKAFGAAAACVAAMGRASCPLLSPKSPFRCQAAGPANPVVVTFKGSGALGCDNHGVRHELPTGLPGLCWDS
jgi:MinD-like ATPase involved in chromosome partitioning or flagellar assembly